MKRAGIGVLCAIGGYVLATLVGYFLIVQFSSNAHDREVEAAMTSAFIAGPIGAVFAFIVGFVRSGRAPAASRTDG